MEPSTNTAAPTKGPIERLDAIEAHLAQQPTQATPHVTIEAPKVDWATILAGIGQGLQIFGPFIVELIEATETKVTFHDPSVVAPKES